MDQEIMIMNESSKVEVQIYKRANWAYVVESREGLMAKKENKNIRGISQISILT